MTNTTSSMLTMVSDDDTARLRLDAAHLPRLVAEAMRAVDADVANGSVWREAVAEALRHVTTAVADDVRLEEAPHGFIAASEDEAPRLVHALERLRAEHAVMLAELHEALALVLGAGRADLEPVVAAVRDVLVRVERHVDVANRIAIEITDRDLGRSE